MIKQTIQFNDIDGIPTTKTLWFNLNRLEISKDMELEVLQERFQKFQDEVFGGDKRDMKPAEVREMFKMIEIIVKASFGVRYGEDNKNFSKAPEHWAVFNDSGQYDGFMWWLFDVPDRANLFMRGIWPNEFQEEFDKEPTLSVVPEAPVAPEESKFTFLDTLSEYTEEYLAKCSDEEFQAIFDHFSEGKNVPFQLIVAGGKRMEAGKTE